MTHTGPAQGLSFYKTWLINHRHLRQVSSATLKYPRLSCKYFSVTRTPLNGRRGAKFQDLPNVAMIKQVITSDLAGEQAESAESDVGGPHLMARSRFKKPCSHTHPPCQPVEGPLTARWPRISWSSTCMRSMCGVHPRRTLAWPLTGRSTHYLDHPASRSTCPMGIFRLGVSQVFLVTPSAVR